MSNVWVVVNELTDKEITVCYKAQTKEQQGSPREYRISFGPDLPEYYSGNNALKKIKKRISEYIQND